MQILAVVDDNAFARFRSGVAGRHEVRRIESVAIDAQLARADSRLVVVDPSLLRPDAFLVLVETVRLRANVAVLVYAPLTPLTARATAAASLIVPIEAVFFGSYDERDALAHVCDLLLVPSVPALVLRGLATAIAAMPRPMATRIVGLFGGQPIPSSTSAMLDGLGVPIDSARDWLFAAGIVKPHHLRAAAMLARAYPYLDRKRLRLEQIVERFGIPSVRALGRASHALTRLSARRAGKLDESEFARRMLSALRDLRVGDTAEG